ncbi:hypothetical protein [Coleofasciculus sp. FACHB-129]|uniref:hypothetical protein n=1 Tax=Cyanophyceae TaxID=3028117 RepID=UPI001681E353|nr:hypothetical protein [Coleofasciculus sp. FACHB-129]MBD1896054.1 hypothetical protein [Coleofasciculus sp. FACHB-129]
MARKPNDKNTKAEILAAYEELSKEKAALDSQLKQLNQSNLPAIKDKQPLESRITMNQAAADQQKMDRVIESLAKLQLGFGSAVSELSEKLTLEASKLQELRGSVATEVQELEELHNLEIAEGMLDTLIQQYEESSKTFEEELSQRRENLEQETLEQKNAWFKEQEERKRSIKERNETQAKTRQRDAKEYKYDLELQRNINQDEYDQTKKGLYKQLEEFQQEKEKQWDEREKAIAEREKQYDEAKAKVEVFPKELEAAIKKAKEEGKGIAHYQTKIKSDLYAKDVEMQKRLHEQRIQSLEETIRNQDARILSLSKQLDSALKQVQDLAVKAIEGASNASSYQSLKEITLEQAKTLQKNK